MAAADFHKGIGKNPESLANRVERVFWQDGNYSDVKVADLSVFPEDFETQVTNNFFIGPDRKVWHKNVLGFGHAPHLCTVSYRENGSPDVTVRAEMFCARVEDLL